MRGSRDMGIKPFFRILDFKRHLAAKPLDLGIGNIIDG
jgi:hypothetical protein